MFLGQFLNNILNINYSQKILSTENSILIFLIILNSEFLRVKCINSSCGSGSGSSPLEEKNLLPGVMRKIVAEQNRFVLKHNILFSFCEKLSLFRLRGQIEPTFCISAHLLTVCPRILDPVRYYIKWVKTSWTNSIWVSICKDPVLQQPYTNQLYTNYAPQH